MMFISRFNKLIRSRIVWGIIAFLVIVSFVAWTTDTGGVKEQDNQGLMGKLDGQGVPHAEFEKARFDSRLAIGLMYGRPVSVTPKLETALRLMAWKRVAALRQAPKFGLTVADSEVFEAIRSQPFFLDNGQFDPARYSAFITSVLPKLDCHEAQFQRFVRDEILIEKIRFILAQYTWVAPSEIEQTFRQLYDEFMVSYARLKLDDVEPGVKVNEADARAYYDRNTPEFRIPAKAAVKIASFSIDDQVDVGAVEDSDVASYYDANIEKFTSTDTNDISFTAPLDEVEEDIRMTLAREQALNAARDRASEFEVYLTPARDNTAPTFEQAAAAFSLNIRTTALFAAGQSVPEAPDAGPDFSKTAFRLRNTPNDYFSFPLNGEKNVYLIALDRKTDARIPAFDEVKAEALEAAREKAAFDALQSKADEILTAVKAAVKSGKSFESALAPFKLKATTTEPFTIASGAETESDTFQTLMRAAINRNEGEVMDAMPVTGGMLIGFVAQRKPADHATLAAIRGDIVQFLKKRRGDMLFAEWQACLVAPGRLEDLHPLPDADEALSDIDDTQYDDQSEYAE